MLKKNSKLIFVRFKSLWRDMVLSGGSHLMEAALFMIKPKLGGTYHFGRILMNERKLVRQVDLNGLSDFGQLLSLLHALLPSHTAPVFVFLRLYLNLAFWQIKKMPLWKLIKVPQKMVEEVILSKNVILTTLPKNGFCLLGPIFEKCINRIFQNYKWP